MIKNPKDIGATNMPGIIGASLNIAVVGGGIGGLVSAYLLAKAGARVTVTVYEASDQLGGLGTFFQYRNVSLERFYHCMLPSDRHLLGVLRELGLEDEIYWKETSFGFMRDGQLYGLNTPLELLRFSPLSLVDRIRVGLTGLWGSVCSSNGLDDVTCVEWLTRISGHRAFETFWKPMLQAKFGDRYHEVPALWFWTRFNREKGGGKKECKGYIRGGYRRIIVALAEAIEAHGGTIRLQAPVEKLDLTEDERLIVHVAQENPHVYDRIVVTTPIFALRKAMADGQLASVAEQIDAGIDMQGVVNAVFTLRRGLTKHYWVATIDEEIPFQGIVESTTLLEKTDTAGVHLVYLMNYVHRTDLRFHQSDAEILDAYMTGLKRLFPDLVDEDVIDRFVFRSPFVEPIYTTGYQQRKPPTTLLPGKLYLATTTQVYPVVTSWDGAAGLAHKVIDELLSQA
ncbi:MAG: FAD-dependent oxidoreductase [Nitrosomonas sp.]|uniref:FAD-dependent oxidoreductase n=1 Tax=Nitrosomonas sp. TaxID=42353 RepID=UPI002736CF71|nr:FAD-dependent oxidoreductase [Nitrosomonas sp.]MDP3280486.1 FAD-dependent oxidoreductase [Nitrosomonas sp.]MDP3662978.1 FAD-dependent oxidoreductase [Nitrosomonas sp.]MDZ4106955.1 FAD-dependent oxidoreductase [Nitrosomonas sp.]